MGRDSLWLTRRDYFSLLRRLVEAPAQVDVWKRSACIEGATHAFARVKMHVPGLGIERVATGGPPESKPHRKPENYLEESLQGAKQIEKICPKDRIFS